MADTRQGTDKEGTTIEPEDTLPHGECDLVGSPRYGSPPAEPTGIADRPDEPPALIARRLARISAKLHEASGVGRDASGGPLDGPGWIDMVAGMLVDEDLWLRQNVSSHSKEGDLTCVTIDFAWTALDTGDSLGPDTFIGYGEDAGDGGVGRALAATLEAYLRHTFLVGPGEAARTTDAAETIAALPAPRLAAPRRPSN